MTKPEISLLRGIEAFRDFSEDDLAALQRVAWIVSEGRIFDESDEGHHLFFVLEGTVDIILTGYELDRDVLLHTLSKGAMFGEIALIDGKKRSTRAEANKDARYLKIELTPQRSRSSATDTTACSKQC